MHLYPVSLVYKYQVRALHLLLVAVATWIGLFIHKTLHGTKIAILILGIGFQGQSKDNKNLQKKQPGGKINTNYVGTA